MAFATIVDIIGLGVTTASILQSAVSNKQENNHASFRIRAALNGHYDDGTLTNAGGDIPDTRVFNEQVNFLGANYDPGHVDDGGFSDYTVNQGNTQEPTFALFTANDDAVCVAYITVTYPSKMDSSWVGTWGKACGHPWYHSDVYFDNHKVDCTWIDANGDATDVTAFHVHWPSFDGNRPHSNNYRDYCNNVRTMNFQYTNDPGTIYTKRSGSGEEESQEVADTPRAKRASKPFARDTRLVRSRIPDQSAVELCESPTSFGPDFVNEIEGMYCDMGTKTLHPICPDGALDLGLDNVLPGLCFDLGSLNMLLDGVVDEAKSFSKVLDWGEGSAM